MHREMEAQMISLYLEGFWLIAKVICQGTVKEKRGSQNKRWEDNIKPKRVDKDGLCKKTKKMAAMNRTR